MLCCLNLSSALFFPSSTLNPTWHITTCRHTFCIAICDLRLKRGQREAKTTVEWRRRRRGIIVTRDQPQSHIFTIHLCKRCRINKLHSPMPCLAIPQNHIAVYLHCVNYNLRHNIVHKLRLKISTVQVFNRKSPVLRLVHHSETNLGTFLSANITQAYAWGIKSL